MKYVLFAKMDQNITEQNNYWKNEKTLEKSGNFVSPEKWEQW